MLGRHAVWRGLRLGVAGLPLLAASGMARDLITGGAPILPPRTQSVPDLRQWHVGVLAKLMTQLQDHGYKALMRSETLQAPTYKSAVEVIETGVDGAKVEIAALPCQAEATACALSFRSSFSDDLHLATEAFCVDVDRHMSLARVFPITSMEGRRGVNMVYVQLYINEPDIQLVTTALRIFGADIDKFRSAYRAAHGG